MNNRFAFLKNKKIVIYGTGKTAQRLLEALRGFSIVGIMDVWKLEGLFQGYPVLTWEEFNLCEADALIIASLSRHYEEIYTRIQFRCAWKNVTVYGADGRNLTDYFMHRGDSIHVRSYFEKSQEELKKKLLDYDAVSFDVFDTLLMREVLEPLDVCAVVERRIEGLGIHIPEFQKKRRMAEIEAAGARLEEIYNCLQRRTGLSEEEKRRVMCVEIQTEKELLIPRRAMADVMRFAIGHGKRVSLISDMYLSREVIQSILEGVGITGYDRLYVSCEYGVGKNNGLFEIYKKEIGDLKALHIGDNEQADVCAAQRYGIDAYSIRSAYAMLQISSLRKLLLYAWSLNTRTWLGMAVAELFNDPFALSGTCGIPCISDDVQMAKIIVAPVAYAYMQALAANVMSSDYDAVLLSARDGYLFKKIYDEWKKVLDLPEAVYFSASRRLCLAAVLFEEADLREVQERFLGSQKPSDFWRQFMGVDPENMPEKEFIACVLQKSEEVRKNYLRYMEQAGILQNGRYLLCDLVAYGTLRRAVAKLFDQPLDAFYLCSRKEAHAVELGVSVYSVREDMVWNSYLESQFFLEEIFTSPEPSVRGMDSDGRQIYMQESRTCSEIGRVNRMQAEILESIRRHMHICGVDFQMEESFAEAMLGLRDRMKFRGTAQEFLSTVFFDDFSGGYTPI